MISEINFQMLELLPKLNVTVEEQLYEDVPGFESLRHALTKIFFAINLNSSRLTSSTAFVKYIISSELQTRTISYSCNVEDGDYGTSHMLSRPLPWVVRVHFESENSMTGTLCSGDNEICSL